MKWIYFQIFLVVASAQLAHASVLPFLANLHHRSEPGTGGLSLYDYCYFDGEQLDCVRQDTQGYLMYERVPDFPKPPTSIALAKDYTCAVSDGDLKCWGPAILSRLPRFENAIESVGLGEKYCVLDQKQVRCFNESSEEIALPIPITDADRLLGPWIVNPYVKHACALSGTKLRCWNEDLNFLKLPEEATQVREVIQEYQHICALLTSGERRCWSSSGVENKEAAEKLWIPKSEIPFVKLPKFSDHQTACGYTAGGKIVCRWHHGIVGEFEANNLQEFTLDFGESFGCFLDGADNLFCFGVTPNRKVWGPTPQHPNGTQGWTNPRFIKRFSKEVCITWNEGTRCFESPNFDGSKPPEIQENFKSDRPLSTGFSFSGSQCTVSFHDIRCTGSRFTLPPEIKNVKQVVHGKYPHSITIWHGDEVSEFAAGQLSKVGSFPDCLAIDWKHILTRRGIMDFNGKVIGHSSWAQSLKLPNQFSYSSDGEMPWSFREWCVYDEGKLKCVGDYPEEILVPDFAGWVGGRLDVYPSAVDPNHHHARCIARANSVECSFFKNAYPKWEKAYSLSFKDYGGFIGGDWSRKYWGYRGDIVRMWGRDFETHYHETVFHRFAGKIFSKETTPAALHLLARVSNPLEKHYLSKWVRILRTSSKSDAAFFESTGALLLPYLEELARIPAYQERLRGFGEKWKEHFASSTKLELTQERLGWGIELLLASVDSGTLKLFSFAEATKWRSLEETLQALLKSSKPFEEKLKVVREQYPELWSFFDKLSKRPLIAPKMSMSLSLTEWLLK